MEQLYQIRVVGNCRGYISISINGNIFTLRLSYENRIDFRR